MGFYNKDSAYTEGGGKIVYIGKYRDDAKQPAARLRGAGRDKKAICPVCNCFFNYGYGASKHWSYKVKARDERSGRLREVKVCSWKCMAEYNRDVEMKEASGDQSYITYKSEGRGRKKYMRD